MWLESAAQFRTWWARNVPKLFQRIFSGKTGPSFLCGAIELQKSCFQLVTLLFWGITVNIKQKGHAFLKSYICLWFVHVYHTFNSFRHMHQQVLLARGRVAVWCLQALVFCVKVRHTDSSFSLTKLSNFLLQTVERRGESYCSKF